MDTRTPRTAPGGTPNGFFDDEPVLSTVKVPCDPAQVVVNHVSFRVRLAAPVPHNATLDSAARLHAAHAGGVPAALGVGRATARPAAGAPAGASAVAGMTGALGAGGARPGRRRAPVVWTGHAGPEDTGANGLLQAAVRAPGAPAPGAVPSAARSGPESATASTQTLPRVAEPLVVGPRDPGPAETTQPLLSGVRPAYGLPGQPGNAGHGVDDGPDGGTHGGPAGSGHAGPGGGPGGGPVGEDGREGDRPPRASARRGDTVRHAYYPGRRMNLGVVLLPLRIFLGFISIYAGMGKLCDPVYFDGGERGSMVLWLSSLEPWAIAQPLHGFALAHPVGSGLTVAFLQVIVGVLTMCGLWQRLAGTIGALLSAALLLTVSWRSVPAYDAPDVVYLAAWTPLIIAGAPVYSMDARLAGEAWRTLGPRVSLWDLRRRVLRRGTVLVTVVAGLALLVGALLGGAVRSTQTVTVPGPDEPPTNHLPGSPLPERSGDREQPGSQGPSSRSPEARRSPSPSASSTGADATGREPGTATPSRRETVRAPQQSATTSAPGTRQRQQPSAVTSSSGATGSPGGGTTSAGGTSSDSSPEGGSGGGSSTTGGGGDSGGGSRSGALGGLLG